MAPSDTKAQGTAFSTAIVIMANLVGAGLLSLPFTFKRSGLLVGSLAMLIMAALNTFSMVVIARCCELSGSYSYKDMAQAALGPLGGTVVAAIMALYTLGSCVSFVVLLGDFLPALICEDGCNTPAQALFGQRIVMQAMVGWAVLYPLSLPRQLSALRYTSSLSAACIVYTSLMIGIRAINGPRAEPSDVHLFSGPQGLAISAPILAVSLCAHYNSAKFYSELADRTIPRFASIATGAFAVVVVMYQATAVGGYLLFGSATKGDVLENFAGECGVLLRIYRQSSQWICMHVIPQYGVTHHYILTPVSYVYPTPAPLCPADDDTAALIARIALSCIVISCFPLAFNAFRGSVTALLPARWQERLVAPSARGAAGGGSGGFPGHKSKLSDADGEEGAASGAGSLDCALLPGSGERGDDEVGSGASRLCCTWRGCRRAVAADWPHAALTKTLVLTAVLIAVLIPQVEVVLGYKGALGGSLIVYVLPAVMLFSLTQQESLGLLRQAQGAAQSDEEGAESEGTPLAAAAGASSSALATGSTAFAPGVWTRRAVLGTPHGWLLIAFSALGLLIMVTGTLTTAGVL